jgi:outer membrane protein with beta-barrel domain
MTPRSRVAGVLPAIVAVFVLSAGDLSAQTRPKPTTPKPAAPRVPTAPPPAFAVRLFGDAGVDRFAATKSFTAILGQDSGPVYGGGAEVVLHGSWFVRVGAWRFKDRGERALRLENQTFRLGIPLTVTIIPIEASAGYRFPLGRRKVLIPYVGGGVSSHSYKETSSFAVGVENVNERFTGYQVLGGVEYRLHRFVGLAGEIQYTAVPDAIGAGGLSQEFNERDLGGVIVRVRVLFGR